MITCKNKPGKRPHRPAIRHAILLSLLAVTCAAGALLPDDGKASIIYYSDTENRFDLKPIDRETGFLVYLEGTSSYPVLMVRLKKERSGKPERMITCSLGGKKKFAFNCMLREGPGTYQVTVFGKESLDGLSYSGLCSFSITATKDLPPCMEGQSLNDKVLSFVKASMGKTVGRGECWDLVQEALDSYGADWLRPTDFGKQLDPARDEIEPGDIIQFRSVRTVTLLPSGGTIIQTIGSPDHTAVIFRVLGDRHYTLAHQNSDGKRYVIISDINLQEIKSGTFRIYRPLAGILR